MKNDKYVFLRAWRHDDDDDGFIIGFRCWWFRFVESVLMYVKKRVANLTTEIQDKSPIRSLCNLIVSEFMFIDDFF